MFYDAEDGTEQKSSVDTGGDNYHRKYKYLNNLWAHISADIISQLFN